MSHISKVILSILIASVSVVLMAWFWAVVFDFKFNLHAIWAIPLITIAAVLIANWLVLPVVEAFSR